MDSRGHQWLKGDLRREKLLLSFIQPMTAMQLSKRTGINLDACSSIMKRLVVFKLAECLNPNSQRSRVFGLTSSGISLLKKVAMEKQVSIEYWIDWNAYGKLCFSHRSAVLKAWKDPNEQLQAVTIRKRARQQNPYLKMSANNVRDVLRVLRKLELVKKIDSPKYYPEFQLSFVAWFFRTLLIRAEKVFSQTLQ